MRAPWGGFVNDLIVLRYPEIHEHPREEGNKEQQQVEEVNEMSEHRLPTGLFGFSL